MKKGFFLFLWVLLLPLFTMAQTPTDYLLADANDYFKAGRYWDAFFVYRDIARHPDYANNYEVTSQIKNSSHALYLKRKYENYAAFRQYELAKKNLIELVELNPTDPNRGDIPKLTLKQAEDLQRLAWRQQTKHATATMLQKSIQLYHLAMREGLKDESVLTLIKMCERSLEQTGITPSETNTTYGIGIQPTQKIEREHEVQIIKEQ